MSKKRVVVLFVLNSLLLVTTMFAMTNLFFEENGLITEGANSLLTYAQYVCPLLIMVVTFIYLFALVHAYNYKGRVPRFIEVLRIIVITAQLLIALVEFSLMIPYRGSFDLYGIDYYTFVLIPILSLIAFIPTKKKYSAFGLLYALIPLAVYSTVVISLAAYGVIEMPYNFLDVLNQQLYKSIINFAVLVAGNTMIVSLLILMSSSGKLEKN